MNMNPGKGTRKSDDMGENPSKGKTVWEAWGVIFSAIAVIFAILTFWVQVAPLLIVDGVRIAEGENRLYLKIKNIGGAGTNHLEGAYAVTAHDEPSGAETSHEKLLGFGRLDIKDEGFYPNQNEKYVDAITSKMNLKEPISTQEHFVYLSILLDYPRWPFPGVLGLSSQNLSAPSGHPELAYLRDRLFFLFNRRYEGIFFYDKKAGRWVKHSKSQLPEFFDFVFSDLKEGKPPAFEEFGTKE